MKGIEDPTIETEDPMIETEDRMKGTGDPKIEIAGSTKETTEDPMKETEDSTRETEDQRRRIGDSTMSLAEEEEEQEEEEEATGAITRTDRRREIGATIAATTKEGTVAGMKLLIHRWTNTLINYNCKRLVAHYQSINQSIKKRVLSCLF